MRRPFVSGYSYESTAQPMDAVAFEAGFGSPTSLRQHFAARLRISPVQYRREFSRNVQHERATHALSA